MRNIMLESRFGFISDSDKEFMIAFDSKMKALGYDFGGSIGSGYCWGRFMIIYAKAGVKSRKVIARIYIRADVIVLRLFFSNIDKHRAYIENAPAHIKDVFTGAHGDCTHCKNDKNGVCKFRKSYTLGGRLSEKCNGLVFEFHQPDLSKLPDYMGLLFEFYRSKRPA